MVTAFHSSWPAGGFRFDANDEFFVIDEGVKEAASFCQWRGGCISSIPSLVSEAIASPGPV